MTRNAWLVVSLTLLAGGVAAWWFLGRGAPLPTPLPEPAAPEVVEAAPEAPDAGTVEVEEAPTGPTGEVRLREDLAERLAGSSGAAWVAAPGLLQRLTAATWLVSQGRSPRSVLGFVSVTGDFAVDETSKLEDPIWIAESSYQRYDRIVEALEKVGPTAAAKIYRATRRSFAREFAQVATDGEDFDTVLRKAIDHLLEVDVPEERIEVNVKGGVFVYADPKLEGLSEAQKHLVRMGPKNASAAQDFLRGLRESL